MEKTATNVLSLDVEAKTELWPQISMNSSPTCDYVDRVHLMTSRAKEVTKCIKNTHFQHLDFESIIDAWHGEIACHLSHKTEQVLQKALQDVLYDRQDQYFDPYTRSPYDKHQPYVLKELVATKLFAHLEYPKPNIKGVKVTADDVIVAPYSSFMILKAALMSIAKPSGIVLMAENFYKNNAIIFKSCGLRIKTYRADLNNNGKIDIDELIRLIRLYKAKDQLCGLFFTYPGNPLIYTFSREELTRIGEIIVKEEIPTIIDSVFTNMAPVEDCVPLASMEVIVNGKEHRLFDYILTISGTSKLTHSPGPWKIGAACSGNTSWLNILKSLLDLNFQRETTHLAKVILESLTQEDIELRRNYYIQQQAKSRELIEKINKAHVCNAIKVYNELPYGPFICASLHPSLLEKAGIKDAWQLQDFLLCGAGIYSLSLAQTGALEIGVRLNVGVPRINNIKKGEFIEDLFSRFGLLISKIKHGFTYSMALGQFNLDKVACAIKKQ